VLLPGVPFFTNQAPAATHWRLEHNLNYRSVAELNRAIPQTDPPSVKAGPDITSDHLAVRLSGSVRDDGKPAGSRLAAHWELLEGPGPVTFADGGAPKCCANFSAPGDYLLRLVADDGERWMSDLLNVHILPRGLKLARAWEFDRPLDAEGWSTSGLGTTHRVETMIKDQEGTSWPVHYVAGGYFIIALEKATVARLLSADHLNVPLDKRQILHLRFQNHTMAREIRVCFITQKHPLWDKTKSATFALTPLDKGMRDYLVPLGEVPGWQGSLQQLRLDLTGDEPATGTLRFDFIRIENPARKEKPIKPNSAAKIEWKPAYDCPMKRMQEGWSKTLAIV
jgi:hypothetical protein